jgi:hypothetical protein
MLRIQYSSEFSAALFLEAIQQDHIIGPSTVAPSYSPNYSGGRDWEEVVQGQPSQKVSKTVSEK